MSLTDPSAPSCPLCPAAPSADTAWTQCDACRRWYHDACLAVPAGDLQRLLLFHCQDCVGTAGPSVPRRLSSRKRVRIDYAALDAGQSLVLKGRHPHIARVLAFPSSPSPSPSGCLQVAPCELTAALLRQTGFGRPVVVPASATTYSATGTRMPAGLSVAEVAARCGADQPIEVMDVLSQDSLRGWTVGAWRDYYLQPHAARDRVRNAISLEVSHTLLAADIVPPRAVRELDLVARAWPAGERRQVSRYCLMSVQDSYTDFHIDFAGTHVYYTVLRGSKVFLLFPPTLRNLRAYTRWSQEKEQNAIFFPDYLEAQSERHKRRRAAPADTADDTEDHRGIKVVLHEGDLMLIPAGWIHAVYTPQDALVVGGNFLSLLSMQRHMAVVRIEKATGVSAKFAFPRFHTSMWYAAHYLYRRTHNDTPHDNRSLGEEALSSSQKDPFSPQEKEGLRVLAQYLQSQLDTANGCCLGGNERRRLKSEIPRKHIGDPQRFAAMFAAWASSLASLDERPNTTSRARIAR